MTAEFNPELRFAVTAWSVPVSGRNMLLDRAQLLTTWDWNPQDDSPEARAEYEYWSRVAAGEHVQVGFDVDGVQTYVVMHVAHVVEPGVLEVEEGDPTYVLRHERRLYLHTVMGMTKSL